MSAPRGFDVFLSHASADKPLVEELARRLTRANLKPWLDKWNLIPGTPWQPAIEAALVDCASCAVFVGPGGLGTWHHEEMRAAIDRRVRVGGGDPEHAFRVIPVLLPGVERPERSKLPSFLVATTWVEFRSSLDEPEAFRRLVCGIRGIEPGAGPEGAAFEGRCPYRGLELFDVAHAPLFFGREALTEWLVDALKRKPSGAENRFLAIVGASGSGKSSLARAGLMAALQDGKLAGSASWPIAICRPGSDPFLSLANALKEVALEADRALVFDRLLEPKDGERALHVAAEVVLGTPPRAERLVVLVDQFEEIFTLCSDEAIRSELITTLLYATTVSGGRTIVVLTLRADFYPRVAAHAGLAAAVSDHQVLVGPMTDDELRRAIERPARLAGLEPEPGLVELLIGDVRGRPGSLPLLQFALRELWQRREAHRLTIGAYRDIGGIEGALKQKADAVYAGFTAEQQELCRRVFLRLVQPGEGSEDTRRRAPIREVLTGARTQAEAIRRVVERLTDPEARLLTTGREQAAAGEGTLEVAHEALIRGWPQLRQWVEADRAGLRTHRRLTEAAQEWADAATEAREGLLYTGGWLAVAGEWAVAHRDELSAPEAAFLSTSQEYQRQREANEVVAKAQDRLATSRQLAALSASERNKHLDLSLLLAVEALRTENSLEARDSLYNALQDRPGLWSFLDTNEGGVGSVAFSPDGKTIAAGYDRGIAGGVVLWDLGTRNRLAEDPLTVKEGAVRSVAFSPDGKTIAAGYSGDVGGGGVVLWDEGTRNRLAEDPLPVKEGRVGSVAFSPDGKTIAAGFRVVGEVGGGVVLWDVVRRKRLAEDPLPVKEGNVNRVAFSPDGKTIAAGCSPDVSGVVLWDVSRRRRLAEDPLPVKEGFVVSVAFSPDGKTIAAGYHVRRGGGVVLWDVGTRRRLAEDPFPVKEGVVSVAFSPDGKTIAVGYSLLGGEFGGVVLWDVGTRKPLSEHPLPAVEGYVESVAFSPDGKTIAAGCSACGGVVLWNVDLESWQRLAGEIANRNFTRDEWRQYFPEKLYRPTFTNLPVPPEVTPRTGPGPSAGLKK